MNREGTNEMVGLFKQHEQREASKGVWKDMPRRRTAKSVVE